MNHSRCLICEILAHHISKRITLDIATESILKLKKQNKVKLNKNAFIHSDQGSHYTSPIFQELLKKNKLGQSMSRSGNCWDNAPHMKNLKEKLIGI